MCEECKETSLFPIESWDSDIKYGCAEDVSFLSKWFFRFRRGVLLVCSG